MNQSLGEKVFHSTMCQADNTSLENWNFSEGLLTLSICALFLQVVPHYMFQTQTLKHEIPLYIIHFLLSVFTLALISQFGTSCWFNSLGYDFYTENEKPGSSYSCECDCNMIQVSDYLCTVAFDFSPRHSSLFQKRFLRRLDKPGIPGLWNTSGMVHRFLKTGIRGSPGF